MMQFRHKLSDLIAEGQRHNIPLDRLIRALEIERLTLELKKILNSNG
jgi:hypothetical protein